MSPNPIKAFVSYAHKDDEFAALFVQELERQGIHAWQDRLQIRVGEKFDDRIFTAIGDSDVFFVLISTHSVGSEWVQRELEYARALTEQNTEQPRIFPILIETTEIPQNIANLNYADFRGEFELPFRQLIASIQGHDDTDSVYKSPFVAQSSYHDTRDNEAVRIYNLGVAAYQRGNLEEAIEYWDAAIKLDPHQFDAAYNAAVAAYDIASRTQTEGAMRAVADRYEKVLTIRPTDVDAMVNLAVIYNTQASVGKLERAKYLLEHATRLAPDYALAWLNLGHYYSFQSGFKQLIETAALSPSDFRALVEDANFLRINWLRNALRCYEKAFELQPGLVQQFPRTAMAFRLMKIVFDG